MQDNEEIILKGLDVLGKVVEKEKDSQPEEADVGGGELPEQQMQAQEIEPEPVPGPYWLQPHVIPIWTGALALIGTIVALKARGKKD